MLVSSRVNKLYDRLFLLVGEPSWLLLSLTLTTLCLHAFVKVVPSLGPAITSSTLGQLVSGLLVYVCATTLLVLPLWIVRGRLRLRQTLGLGGRRLTLLDTGRVIVLWGIYMVATIVAGIMAVWLLPFVDPSQTQTIGFRDIDTPAEYGMAFMALVVLPPIAEELMFRGYLFGRMRSRFGFWISTIAVSVVFGFVHQQWNVGIDTFILSLFLCYLREKTGSIWASMLLHGLKNAVAYFLLFIAPLLGWHLIQ